MSALAWRRPKVEAPRYGASTTPLRGLLPLVALLGGWELIGDPDSFTFPPPSTWISALDFLQERGELLPAIGETTRTFVISLMIATVVGAALGTAIGASRWVSRALAPSLEFLRALPPPAIVPLAVLLFGINSGTAIIVVSFASMWPVLLSTTAAMRAIPSLRLEVARTLNLSRYERLRKVILPSLLPGIALGLRLAAPLTLIVTLVVEILASIEGTGTLLIAGQRGFDAAQVFGLLVVIGALGLLINFAVAVGERWLLRTWPPDRRASAV